MKCHAPGCNKEVPISKGKKKRVTCSKKCSGIWNWLSGKEREKIRGKKYNKK